MKKSVFIVVVAVLVSFLIPSLIYADYVSGYTRKDGTYVSGYNRSSPNSTVRDNYSYEGNKNPYTGEEGSNHYRNNPTSEYYGTSKKGSGW